MADRGLPLVLSYPENGLLHRDGQHVPTLLDERFTIKQAYHITLQHSTLGASKGSHVKSALEGVYVCVPT